ncbi:MAG: LCP family protein [Actinomycetota bacterium]
MRGTIITTQVLVALLAVGALVASGFAWATVRRFTSDIQHGAALPTVAANEANPVKRDIDGKDQNILLLGNDSVQGATPAEIAALGTTSDRNSQATDTMMIMHIPANGTKATLISFPRDSWVDIPGQGKAKLNSAYAGAFVAAKDKGMTDADATSAGISLTAQTLTQLTGLHIDHYVQINLLGFYEISEAIGGVDVCLNAAQNKYTENDDGTHPNGYTGINLKAGWNYNVKGLQAEAFVRQRHGLLGSDFARIARQQYFLSAVFKKVASAGMLFNPLKLTAVFKAVSKSLFTDPGLDVLSFVQQFQKISAGNIVFGKLPIVDPDGHADGLSVVLIDPDAVKQYIRQLIGVPTDPKLANAAPIAPGAVRVQVLNGSGQTGTAARNATAMQQAGFQASIGDADATRPATTILYGDGMQAQAMTVARWFPKAQLVLTPGATAVTLVLGQDGQQAKAPVGPSPQPAAPARPSSPQPSGTTNAAQNANGCIN